MEKRLINAVIRQLRDKNYLEDVCNGGADAGFPGFSYYNDTIKFYKNNKKQILQLAEEMADDFGEDMLVMIAGFNCLKDLKLTGWQVAQALDGKGEDADLVQNAMAWFALEEVARLEGN